MQKILYLYCQLFRT